MPSNNYNFFNDPTVSTASPTVTTFLLYGDGASRPVWRGSTGETDPNSGLAFIAFDAIVSVTHEGENQVTEYPVESGSNVTDLSRPRPRKLTISGIITDAPVNQLWGQYNGGNLTSLGNSSPNEALKATDPGATWNAAGRPKFAFALLDLLRQRSVVFTVNTALETYNNMVIESCTINVTQTTGAALSATVVMKELRIVSSQTVAPLASDHKNAPKDDGGTTSTVTDASRVTGSKLYEAALSTRGAVQGNYSGGPNNANSDPNFFDP